MIFLIYCSHPAAAASLGHVLKYMQRDHQEMYPTLRKQVVSLKKGDPNIDPKYHNPFNWDLEEGTPNFGKPPTIASHKQHQYQHAVPP